MLSLEDQKYIGPNYEKYKSIRRGRADKLFMDGKRVDVGKVSAIFSGETGGFSGLVDDCMGIVTALSHLPVYSGAMATRGVNNFKDVRSGKDFLFAVRQQALMGRRTPSPRS